MINTKIFFSCRSDVGLVRKNNEDNFFCNGEILKNQDKFSLSGNSESPSIFAICDGMGGEAHGELASFIAVSTLKEYSEKTKSAALSLNQIDEAVQVFITDTNNKICKIMRENSFRMGTTLALVIISESCVKAY
ncbi:MAG: protein phosphatase 2C domain-containing protein, partial [Synergistaceae bacterium]|nr:protein phosphatase 2C domain-containing protein [Synergistaceae bacterium]